MSKSINHLFRLFVMIGLLGLTFFLSQAYFVRLAVEANQTFSITKLASRVAFIIIINTLMMYVCGYISSRFYVKGSVNKGISVVFFILTLVWTLFVACALWMPTTLPEVYKWLVAKIIYTPMSFLPAIYVLDFLAAQHLTIALRKDVNS